MVFTSVLNDDKMAACGFSGIFTTGNVFIHFKKFHLIRKMNFRKTEKLPGLIYELKDIFE